MLKIPKIFTLFLLFIFVQKVNSQSLSPIFVTEKSGTCISGNCENGKGKYKFDDGDIYEGNFKSKLANGEGKYTISEGYWYEGNWQNGKIITGIFFDIDENSIYNGEFSTITTKDYYEFVPHGNGTLKLNSGEEIKGFWQYGEQELFRSFAIAKSLKSKPNFTNSYKAVYENIEFYNLTMIGRATKNGVLGKTTRQSVNGKILRALRFQNITRTVEKKYKLPENILLAMIIQETGGVSALPNSGNDGGIGLCHMQGIVGEEFDLETVCNKNCRIVCKKHGRYLYNKISNNKKDISKLSKIDDRFHPVLNIDAAGRMLAKYKGGRKIGNLKPIQKAIRRYAGKKNYKKYLRNVQIFRAYLSDKKRINEIRTKFNKLNPNFKIVTPTSTIKNATFDDYIRVHQNLAYNYRFRLYEKEVKNKPGIYGFYIITNSNNNLVLNVKNSSKKQKTRITQTKEKYKTGQKWKIEAVGGGYYRITALCSNMCLTVENSSKKLAFIRQEIYKNKDSQKWKFKMSDGGYFKIISKRSDLALTGKKGKTSGAYIMQNSAGKTTVQLWKLYPIYVK